MDFESAIEKVYGRGRFCIIFAIGLSLLTALMAYELQSIVFLGFSNDFNCSDERILNSSSYIWISEAVFSGNNATNVGNNSISSEQCYAMTMNEDGKRELLACEQFKYDTSMMKRTLTTDFDLVCSRKKYGSALASATMIAASLGYLLAIFSDRFRRKWVLIFYMVMDIVWSILTPLSTNFIFIFICRVMRMLSMPLYFVAVSMLYEILPASKRTHYGNFYWTAYCLGYLGTPGLAYLTQDWQMFRYYGLIALLIYIPLFFLLLESPRWLLLNGKYEEYRDVLAKLAARNGVKLPPGFLDSLGELPEVEKKSESVLDLFRSPNVRTVLLIFCLTLGATCCCYYELSTSADSVTDNVFWNTFIMGFSELFSGCIGWILCCHFNRRNSYILASVLVIVSFLISPAIRPLYPIANIAVVSVGKLMVTVELNIILLHSAEFFPTTVRNMGFFLVMAMGTSAGGLVPYINDLSNISPYLSGGIFAGMNIASAFLDHFFLPNTKNCPMAQTISQTESLRRGREKEWKNTMLKSKFESGVN